MLPQSGNVPGFLKFYHVHIKGGILTDTSIHTKDIKQVKYFAKRQVLIVLSKTELKVLKTTASWIV